MLADVSIDDPHFVPQARIRELMPVSDLPAYRTMVRSIDPNSLARHRAPKSNRSCKPSAGSGSTFSICSEGANAERFAAERIGVPYATGL